MNLDMLTNFTVLCVIEPTFEISLILELLTGSELGRRLTKFVEITQCNGHYAVQGHSRSPILVRIESSYATFYQ